jgi:hypothetical protein
LPWGVPWDRSEAQSRDLQFSQPVFDVDRSAALPFVNRSEAYLPGDPQTSAPTQSSQCHSNLFMKFF